MTYYNYIVVSGRIPFDDEDTMLFFEHCTEEEACQRFSDEMYDGDEDARRCDIRNTGSEHGVIINAILASETPFTVVC